MPSDILLGFKDVALALVTRDDVQGYSTGDGVPMPYGVKLEQRYDTAFTDAFSDDGTKQRVPSVRGNRTILHLAGFDTESLIRLKLSKSEGDIWPIYHGLPRGGQAYSLRFVSSTIDNTTVYATRFRIFWVQEVHWSDHISRGLPNPVRSFMLIGWIRPPKCTRYPYFSTIRLDSADPDYGPRKAFLLGSEC